MYIEKVHYLDKISFLIRVSPCVGKRGLIESTEWERENDSLLVRGEVAGNGGGRKEEPFY